MCERSRRLYDDCMKQRAHAWVALRALKMVDDWGGAPELTELLSYYLSDVWDGAWLPDIRIVDMGYGHIFKMDSDPEFIYQKLPEELWYIKSDKDLASLLVGNRLCLEYVKGFEELAQPYRTHPVEGGHLPNRVIALSHTIGDMLKMSDFPLAAYAQKKGQVKRVRNASGSMTILDLSSRAIKDLSSSPNFSARQIALMFFLISHYICDAHMPLHCDLRDMSARSEKTSKKERRLPESLHPWIEEYWEKCFPAKEDLILTDYTEETLDEILVKKMPEGSIIEIDKDGSNYALSEKVESRLKGDEWTEMVYTTRVSYAVARKWIPKGADWFSLMPKENGDFEGHISRGEGFGDGRFVEDLKHASNCIFHDAVESIARIWYTSWRRFTE